jgi:hypothetical protein
MSLLPKGRPLPERPAASAFPWLDFLLMPERGPVEGHGHLSPLVLLIALGLALGIVLYIFLHPCRQQWVTPFAEERSSLWTWKLFLEQFARLLGFLLRNLHETRVRRGLTGSVQMAALNSELPKIRDLSGRYFSGRIQKVSRVRRQAKGTGTMPIDFHRMSFAQHFALLSPTPPLLQSLGHSLRHLPCYSTPSLDSSQGWRNLRINLGLVRVTSE